MTKYCRWATQGFILGAIRLDGSPIVITKIWFEDAIFVYTTCASCRSG